MASSPFSKPTIKFSSLELNSIPFKTSARSSGPSLEAQPDALLYDVNFNLSFNIKALLSIRKLYLINKF